MRSHYLRQLSELEELLGKMGGLIVGGFKSAQDAIKMRGGESIRDAEKAEARTDTKSEEIERLCSLLLLTQQPVASDMRFIVSVMNIVVDMERIGDQVRDIAETAGKCRCPIDLPEINEMSDGCAFMIRGALEAFVGRDTDRARKVIKNDDIIDCAFDRLKVKLSEWARTGTDTEDLLNLLMIGKYLERIGDHTTNIAEWTGYVVSGKKD